MTSGLVTNGCFIALNVAMILGGTPFMWAHVVMIAIHVMVCGAYIGAWLVTR